MLKVSVVILVATLAQVDRASSGGLYWGSLSMICGWSTYDRKGLCQGTFADRKCTNELHKLICEPFKVLDKKYDAKEISLNKEFYAMYTRDDLCTTRACKNSPKSKMPGLTIVFNVPYLFFGVIMVRDKKKFVDQLDTLYQGTTTWKRGGLSTCINSGLFPQGTCNTDTTIRSAGSSEFFFNVFQFVSESEGELDTALCEGKGDDKVCQSLSKLIDKIQSMEGEVRN